MIITQNKKKGKINIGKSKKINEDNEKNLQLKEEYTNKIIELKQSIEEAFTVLGEYGKVISLNEAETILNADLNDDFISLSRALLRAKNGWEDPSGDIDNLIKNYNLDRAYDLIKSYTKAKSANGMYEHAGGHSLRKLIDNTYKSSDDLKTLFSKEIIKLEKETGYDLPTLKNKIQSAKASIAKFHELYEELVKMDPSRPQDKDTSSDKHSENPEWIKTAESFLSSIQNFFGVNKQETTSTTKIEMEEEKECSFMGLFCTPKKQDKATESVRKEDVSPSWKISLDPTKWFNQFISSKNSDENSPTEDEINNNQVSENVEYNLGSDFVTKEIHSYHQSLVQYGVTAAKAACFAPVIAGLKHTSETCAIERTKEATAKFTSPTRVNVEEDENSVDSTSVVVIKSNSQGLVQSNNKYTSETCEDLIQGFYTLAENCNDIFWMETTIDDTIQEGLENAVLTKAKVNDDGNVVLVSSDGFEIEMTSNTREFTSVDLAGAIESGASSDILMIE